MFRLKPTLEIPPSRCAYCGGGLDARGWTIVGMRSLADLYCPQCEREFYVDLPAGQALYTPVLLDKKTGSVKNDSNARWFSDWLADSFSRRTNAPLHFNVRKMSAAKDRVILLNCLDTLYGHSLLKLLNAQHYIDHQPDASLIVVVPSFLEWMIPDGIAEAWIVDLPLSRGTEWNDWLADEIRARVEEFPEIHLSVAFSHPHHDDFDIERFTRVAPFSFERFESQQNRPAITYIWRDDRLWAEAGIRPSRLRNSAMKLFGSSDRSKDLQTRKVVELAERLREEFPALDFAVVGLGDAEGLPSWINDARSRKPDAETERAWCEIYAKSHIVVGVHGSNMLLPSAHAGSVIELIGEDRLGNYLQDILFRPSDCREMFFRYRFVPLTTEPKTLADIARTILRYGDFRKLMSPEYCNHRETYDFEKWLIPGKSETI